MAGRPKRYNLVLSEDQVLALVENLRAIRTSLEKGDTLMMLRGESGVTQKNREGVVKVGITPLAALSNQARYIERLFALQQGARRIAEATDADQESMLRA